MPNIKTFCRVKPTKDTFKEHDITNNTLYLRVPELLKDYAVVKQGSRTTINHEFNFDYIFNQDASQEEVFNIAALDIVNAFLSGYNGTIFAYGQTGTGKTYTVEGSAKTYKSRGLEPRALSLIYKELEKRDVEDLSVHISYLEIYQEVGYDLLNPGARTQSYVTPFPKVSVLDGPSGVCIVKNLSNHLAASEDVAQSLLLQGQANRKVAATAIHDRSSRSHAVFTIQLTAKKLDSDTVLKSKLHLVDLAGSERVAKTGVLGQQLEEAKCINLSLHYLESVIVALQQDAKDKINRAKTSYASRRAASGVVRPSSADGYRQPRHVPYRNSLLTMLLRDSLGGNCMTAMIATISLEFYNIGESISTCRFAGRVACIANAVSRNEELDEKSLIKKLRKRINELEAEIACLRLAENGEGSGGDKSMHLTEDDKIVCAQVVRQYLAGKITDPVAAGITNPYKFRECLKILKRVVSKGGHDPGSNGMNQSLNVTLPRHSPIENGTSPVNGEVADDTIQRHNVQKLRLDDERDNRVSSGPSRESRPPRRAPTSAWSEAPRQPSSAPAGDQMYKSNSKQKEPETFTMMPMPEKYRSPFEQKRQVEIKKLNNKVEKIQTERQEKEQEVVDLKIQVATKELDLMDRHMSTKIAVTRAQVEDQKAYVRQLTSTEADPELVTQEKLVERQLRKRLEKYEKQLGYIEYRRDQLKKQVETGVEVTEKQDTVQDKFGQFRKNDGSLNTRQVFLMLKEEEKKQHKAKHQVERERILASANLMEMRELATRQKLRELKEALNTGTAFGPANGQGGDPAPHSAPPNGRVAVNGVDGQNQNGSAKPSFNSSRNGTFILEPGKADLKRSDSNSSAKNNMQQVPNSDFYAKKKTEKDPKSKWESNYTRPTTPSNINIPEPAKKSEDSKTVPKENGVTNTNGNEDDGRFVNRNRGNSSNVSRSETTNGLTEDLIEAKSRKLEEELYNSKNQKYRDRHKSLYESPQKLQTVIPSEYVSSTNADQFDARRMGLSAKNFDSALTSMLSNENQRLIPEEKDYDEFARTSKYRPNPYVESHSLSAPQRSRSSPPKAARNSSKERRREAVTPEKKTRDQPDAESSPMSAKIKRYIQQSPSKVRKQRPKEKVRPSTQGNPVQQEFDMTKYLQTSGFNQSGTSLEIEEEQPGRIRAMQEQERETTYMSKAQVEKERVQRIRRARQSAEVIQRAWRKYIRKKFRKR